MRRPTTIGQKTAGALLVVVLLPLLVPLVIIALAAFAIHRTALYLLVWLLWIPRGKDTLFVYSESPIWREYMTEQVLPLIQERAVVLNWSERGTWKRWRLTQQLFFAFGRRREFNPMVVVFRPLRRARIFRFFSAFKEWKLGDKQPVERLTNDLRLIL